MKVLAIFMTMMLLITGFDLCEKESASDHQEKTEISKTTKEKSAADACSPFCHCARCPFSGLPPGILSNVQCFDIIVTDFIESYGGMPTDVSNSVWQPPKTIMS